MWAAAQSFEEVPADEQIAANDYLSEISANDGRSFKVLAPPYQFDQQPSTQGRAAPELGQHTEEILLDLGMSWDEVSSYRESGALG